MANSKPNLISFDICPFVQRSVITLLEKGVEFDVTYIDLENPPQWFLAVSPFGKVPALQVGDVTLFESAVINEYLDEVNPPSMHPADPLRRAHNRAWIEFASELLGAQYGLMMAADEDTFETQHHDCQKKIGQVEQQLGDGPFFNGADFCLIDAAFAPAFQRFDILDQAYPLDLYNEAPKTKRWAQSLVNRPSVQQSVPEAFAAKVKDYIKNSGTFAASVFG